MSYITLAGVDQKKGLNYKIRYLARIHLEKKLDIDLQKFRYHEDRVVWIHDKEVLTKKEYNAQIKGFPHGNLSFRGSLPILYSLGDAIQILSRLHTDEERAKLIRKLIIKIEELQEELNKKQKDDINDRKELLEQFDIVCYNFIKEHGIDYWHGYKIYYPCRRGSKGEKLAKKTEREILPLQAWIKSK